jgi:hypothetical protein
VNGAAARSVAGAATRKTGDVLGEVSTAEWANEQVGAVRDDPAARIDLVERLYHGPFGAAPRHLPYSRAALSFMRWQLRRGVLAPPHDERPGSPSWRAVNEGASLEVLAP